MGGIAGLIFRQPLPVGAVCLVGGGPAIHPLNVAERVRQPVSAGEPRGEGVNQSRGEVPQSVLTLVNAQAVECGKEKKRGHA